MAAVDLGGLDAGWMDWFMCVGSRGMVRTLAIVDVAYSSMKMIVSQGENSLHYIYGRVDQPITIGQS